MQTIKNFETVERKREKLLVKKELLVCVNQMNIL